MQSDSSEVGRLVFGKIEWSTSGVTLPPEQPSLLLYCSTEGRVVVKNITVDSFVEVDCYRLGPKEELVLEDGSIVSIYGWRDDINLNEDRGNRELAYLYGLDPKSLELVRHHPDRHGASVQAENVAKTFKRSDGTLAGIKDVSFEIAPSTLVGVYGESGIGKSVLINSLIVPNSDCQYSGRVLVDGMPVSKESGIAYLPQRLSFPDVLTAREIISQSQSRVGCTDERKKRILELCHVELDKWGTVRCGRLSGGQQRRLALAAALLDERVRAIVADEPTTGLDIGTERDVMRGLRRLVRLENVTVIVVTHSVYALPIFDKVLVLCKSEGKSAARLCFDSKWLPDFFPEELKLIRQDSDRLTALFEGRVSQNFVVRNKFQSPYYRQISGERVSVVKKFHSFTRQAISWISNVVKMAIRQKTFWYFLLLSTVCVLMIQQGTCQSPSRCETFLCFMSLCAPWLCATYTAMFGAELLKWFSWEKISGGSSRSFCAGILGGLLLPYACISLIFTIGLFFPINMERVVDETYSFLSGRSSQSAIVRFLNEDDKNQYANDMSGEWRNDAFAPRVWLDPPQLEVGIAHLGCKESQGGPYSQDYAAVCRSEAQPKSIWTLMLIQWGVMTMICFVGGTIGLAAISLFRDAKTSVLAIVILFIAFIMLSRVCVLKTECMLALKFSNAGKLNSSDVGWIPLIYMSYLGIGRFAYNVLVYPLHGAFLYDFLPLLGWGVSSIIVVLKKLGSRRDSWKAFDR